MTSSVYADAELLLHDYLQGLFPAPVRVVTELPATVGDGVTYIRVERIGGGDAGRSIDVPSLDVDVFAPDRPTANALAGQVRTALRHANGYTAYQATVADIAVHSFGWRPYTNTNVRSVGMSVDLTLHNHQ